jgi:xanthine dehydrogenase accessory factor
MNANLYSKLYQTLKNGKGAVLVRIVRREGSAPRGVGSVCLVDADGTLFGTIGGGLLEYKAVEKAKVLLKKRITSLTTVKMTAKKIAEEGMICGGRVELFFEPILPEDDTVEFFRTINDLFQSGGSGTLITLIRDEADVSAPDTRILVDKEGRVTGSIPFVKLPEHAIQAHLIEGEGTGRGLFLEPVVQNPELLLFGGGHISTFVSSLAKTIGFDVSVFDDLGEFANRERFPEVNEIYHMSYKDALENIAITESSYIVIVTRGHGGDKDVLELVLKSGASPAYVGMIGSIRKRDTIYKALMENEISQKALAAVHCPVGLDIGARTPEEIAVSIIAEVIQVKSRQ